MEKNDPEIEQFPVEKRQIKYEEPPELIFFDVDDEGEEADFIRVDDLFAMESGEETALTGPVAFTLFPRRSGELISSRLSRLIRRTLMLSAARFERPLLKTRVRPQFAQWQIELTDSDSAEDLVRAFRDDLEYQVRSSRGEVTNAYFWSPNCFVCPTDKEISDEVIVRVASSYQE